MSLPVDCCQPCCTTPAPVNVIGTPGATGAGGDDGISAYALVSGQNGTPGNVTIPAVGNDVIVDFNGPGLTPTAWMVVGQVVILGEGQTVLANPGPGTFTIASVNSDTRATLTFLGATGDAAPGAVISAGAICSPAGQPGAAAATIVPVIASDASLTQTINASPAWNKIGAVGIALVADLTNHLYFAHCTVRMTGATFASSRDISVRIYNVTQAAAIATTVRATGVQTTVTLPDIDIVLPMITDATGNAADVIELQINVSVVPSAGTLVATAGSLCAIPLA